ncbi:aminopeptidase [Paenibacillus alginolyticus]|uniref:Aminopeptidase n=1 Tax=Paenibacillus alginolyticus TaxID=59839 RepID=A0ABT4GKV1_9BACL|nr:aminopeptidase [Paenibacillus alginolyticus]MCY9696726.1 aminopeptidase [Paenibacillus alginolyticus]MEC0147573.1 aminopeptidase [Paenibacillus alginolyticus]
METFEHYLDKYAELAIRVGLNVQKDQTVVIMTPVTCADFVRKLTKKAYDAGAKDVVIDWDDDEVKALRIKHAPESTLREYPMWRASGLEEMAKEGAAFLQIYAPNSDLLKDVDPERIAIASKTTATVREGFLKYLRSNQVNWLMVSFPTAEWSAKVFPDLSEAERIKKLWEQIFKLTRVDKEDPVAAWKQHIETLTEKQNLLNNKKYKQLHFKAPGTDLYIELAPKHQWVAAGSESERGIFFVPNIPTEEVFTMPARNGTNGIVRSTLPLSYQGSLIDGFSLKFENGRVVEATAEVGQEVLNKMLDMDEGARYLGEVALVPHDSPISQSGLIYYNTLFDENASCHVALGNSYPFTIEGGTTMSPEELTQNGYNKSLIHVDFMIGAADMEIDGILADGSREALFRKGNWA